MKIRETLPPDIREALEAVIGYLWAAEERDYWENCSDHPEDNQRDGHVFTQLQRLRQWLDYDPDQARQALLSLVDTIEAAGGVETQEGGTLAPAGDPEWTDLADVYVSACAALGKDPQIAAEETSETPELDPEDLCTCGHSDMDHGEDDRCIHAECGCSAFEPQDEEDE